MTIIESGYVGANAPIAIDRAAFAAADGTVTDGRKGIAYLRDYFVPNSVAGLDDLVSADAG